MYYEYDQLVPVIFGNGAIRSLGEKVKELGCRKVMLVYDNGVKAAGIASKAAASLEDAGVDFVIYDKVSADPADVLVNECGKMAADSEVDGFVGVGGGGSMDCAKAAALLIDHPAPIEQYFTAPPSFLECSIPVVLVPTTAGTGSEVTQVAVITKSEDHSKPSIFMRSALAIVDPELTYTVPPAVTANTGLDAFTHAAEAITARGRNPRSELLAKAAIEKITKYLPLAVKDGSDKKARFELALAANWAGIAFQDTDCHLGHCMADSISAAFHTPHGYNCILVTPELMAACAAVVPDKVKIVAEAVGVDISDSDTPETIGQKCADGIRALMRACGVKGPEENGMDKDVFIDCCKMAMEIDLGLRLNCPFEPTIDIVRDIYRKTYENLR